jgi:hypothetical protein
MVEAVVWGLMRGVDLRQGSATDTRNRFFTVSDSLGV